MTKEFAKASNELKPGFSYSDRTFPSVDQCFRLYFPWLYRCDGPTRRDLSAQTVTVDGDKYTLLTREDIDALKAETPRRWDCLDDI